MTIGASRIYRGLAEYSHTARLNQLGVDARYCTRCYLWFRLLIVPLSGASMVWLQVFHRRWGCSSTVSLRPTPTPTHSLAATHAHASSSPRKLPGCVHTHRPACTRGPSTRPRLYPHPSIRLRLRPHPHPCLHLRLRHHPQSRRNHTPTRSLTATHMLASSTTQAITVCARTHRLTCKHLLSSRSCPHTRLACVPTHFLALTRAHATSTTRSSPGNAHTHRLTRNQWRTTRPHPHPHSRHCAPTLCTHVHSSR